MKFAYTLSKVSGMPPLVLLLALLLVHLAAAGTALADRRPVLRQIDVPHDYYFREMYLPQLTSGPSALSFSPDGRELVYSMQGSLWQQAVDSGVARQLTNGPGYDYQPDWSPDGRHVVFVRYHNDAMELQLLDLKNGSVKALTRGDAVNVEPRWSPDGTGLAYVSTRGTGRFHIRVGSVVNGRLEARRLRPERQSSVPRYYYSAYDHDLSPSWAPDGDALLYVSNPDIRYGTGAIWMQYLNDDAEPVLVRHEETTWKARPDWSRDGRRVAYASYLGRQWQQLWVTTVANAAEPFPLSYGDFDISAPRWSPSADRIAYISNESGNTAIVVQEVVGGATHTLDITERRYLAPMTSLNLQLVDERGEPLAARVAILGADGRSYAPHDAWMHADDGFDRQHAEFETSYFHMDGATSLSLPPGKATITAWRGPGYGIERQELELAPAPGNRASITLRALELPDDWAGWTSGDVHVHMNYGGTYRNTPTHLVEQASAEDLDVVFNLIVNKEQRIPDVGYFSPAPDSASTPDTLLVHAQEFHTSVWGHMGLLGLDSHLLLPDYSAYPGTAAASLFPDNARVAELARAQGAIVGYVHPFLSPPPDPRTDEQLTNELPVDAALGLVDYYEVVGFADHRASAEVWYRLLNCGARIAAAGGTDAMANYASLRGPVGLNRTYVRTEAADDSPDARRDGWLDGLASGRSMATNAPLIGLTVDDAHPGDVISLADGGRTLRFEGFLRSAVAVDHLELVHNGKVIESFDIDAGGDSADIEGQVTVESSGWLLLRAWNDAADPLVFDLYPYATTSPVYLNVGDTPPVSPDDAAYFLAWIERIRDFAMSHDDYNFAAERDAILEHIRQATRFYEACRQGGS